MCSVHSLSSHSKGQVGTAFAPPSEEGAPSPLERLPNEILAKIARELPARYPESPSLALEAVRNLVQTSKKMYQTFNTLYITHTFLRTLAKNYGEKAEEYAVFLRTLGARRFLQNHIHKSGLDVAHIITEGLISLTFQVFERAKKVFNREKPSRFGSQTFTHEACSHLHLPHSQTEKGFLMYIDEISLRISHPFGAITIYNWDYKRPECSTWIFSIAEVLLHYLKGTFRGITNTCEDYLKVSQTLRTHPKPMRKVPPSPSPNNIRNIKLADMPEVEFHSLEEMVGSHMLIVDLAGPYSSIYDLRCIFGQTLPKPELKTFSKKSVKLMQTITSMLDEERSKNGSTTHSVAHSGHAPRPKAIGVFEIM